MSEAGLLTLVQWLSPAFPVGGYAYSQGLEWVISAGIITDAAGLQSWLGDSLAQGAAQMDAVLLALALQPGADLAGLDVVARALAPSRERLAETLALGAAFGLAVNALTGAEQPPMAYPVVVGAAARGLGLEPQRVVALFLQAQISTLVQIAVRFVPLGQTDGQRVLAALQPSIAAAAAAACVTPLEAIGSAGLVADLASMQHEVMDVRLFRT